MFAGLVIALNRLLSEPTSAGRTEFRICRHRRAARLAIFGYGLRFHSVFPRHVVTSPNRSGHSVSDEARQLYSWRDIKMIPWSRILPRCARNN